MTSHYAVGRQRDHLPMTDAEFDRRLGAIERAFDAAWLATADAVLPNLWRRKDAFAVNQLCLFGDAVAGFEAIDPKWLRSHVEKIKGGDANERRGSMFELMGANLFRYPPQDIKPTVRNAPGYDAVLTASDGATADISMKSYGTSAHELNFRKEAARTEDEVRRFFGGRGAGGVFFAIAKDYPSAVDWNELRAAVAGLTEGASCVVGVWAVKRGGLPPDFAPYSRNQISYQLFLGAPFHRNESKNLSDKFDSAFANAEKHARQASDHVRLVLMRVPETMSLPACDGWVKDYLARNPETPIDAVMLYQLATIDQPDGTSVIGHSILISKTPRFETWCQARKQKPPLSINLAVGVGSPPSRVQLTNGPSNASFTDGYYYQHGEFYTAYQATQNKPTNALIRNLASGIFQHAVIVDVDGNESVLGGYFPPSKEIALFH